MKDRARIVDGILLVVGVVTLFAIPHTIGGDGEARFQTLESLFATGHLTSARYSVVMPLLAAPLYAINHSRDVTALLNPILFVVGLAIIGRDLRDEVTPVQRRSVLVMLVYASMFANHVQAFYGEVFTSLALTVGILWLSRAQKARGWIAIVLGAVNAPSVMVGVALVAIREAHRTKRWWPLAMPILAFALTRLEALLVRGGATGYESDAGFHTALPYSGKPGFSYPFVFGVLAILVSFGKGLAFFTPGLFVPMPKDAPARLREVQATLLWLVAGLVLAYAKWWAWYGGTFWGPRFFLVASVPACLSLALWLESRPEVSLPMRALQTVVVLLSFWVGVNGLVFDQAGLGMCTANDYALEAFCLYVPEMSALWHPFVDFASAVPEKTRPLAIGVCLWWTAAAFWTARHLIGDLARRIRR